LKVENDKNRIPDARGCCCHLYKNFRFIEKVGVLWFYSKGKGRSLNIGPAYFK